MIFSSNGFAFILVGDDMVREVALWLILIHLLVGITLDLHALHNDAVSAEHRVRGGVEVLPPGQYVSRWSVPDASNGYTLGFRIDVVEEGDREYSRIFDFGIMVVEKGDGRQGVHVYPHSVDPISGINYSIPISFTKLLGSNATTSDAWRASWGGGLSDGFTEYEIKGRVHGGGVLYLVDEKHAFINGTLTFDDWEPGKYYIIVWAVDEYGNARIVAYDL